MSKKLFFCLILVIILSAVAVYWPRFTEWQIGSDALEYHKLAVNLLDGKGFYLEERGGRTMFREPGYPFFLFLNYKIFGVHPNLIRIEQLLMLFLICFLTYVVAKKFFGETIGRLAAVAVVLHPLFTIYAGEIWSETLAAFLVILFIFSLVKSFEEKNFFWALSAGLALGAVVLTKSIFMFLPFLIVPFYLIISGEKKFLKALLFASAFFLAIFPWLARNHFYFDKWAIADRGGWVTYMHTSKSELSTKDFKNYVISGLLSQYFVRLKDPSFDIFNIYLDPPNKKRQSFLDQGYSAAQADNLLLKESKKLWLKYPLKNFLIGFVELNKANSPTIPQNYIMFVYDVSGSAFSRFFKGAAIIFIRFLWLFFLFFVLYGAVKIVKEKKYDALPLVVIIFYLNFLLFFLEGVPRSIFPIYSLYFIFFAHGVYYLHKNLCLSKKI